MAARRDSAGYAALVALLVTSTVAAGAVFFQLFQQTGHEHAGVATTSALPITVDAAGFAVMLLLGLQLMSGYHLIAVRGERFRRLHVPVAWAVAGVLAYHAGAGVLHSLQAPVETLPLVLDVIGVVLLVLVSAQVASGYRRSRPAGGRAGAVHALVALALIAIVVGHAALGIAHTMAA